MIHLKSLITENSFPWKSPSIQGANENIDMLCDDLLLEKDTVLKSFNTGQIVYFSPSKLEKLKNAKIPQVNTFLDLVEYMQSEQKKNPEYNRDWKSIKNALKKKDMMEAPVVMKHKNDYYLLDGNIRLMTARILNETPMVYLFRYHG